MFKKTEAAEVVRHIKDEMTVAIGGAGAGHAVPDKVLQALSQHFLQTGHPRSLTTIHPVDQRWKRKISTITPESCVQFFSIHTGALK